MGANLAVNEAEQDTAKHQDGGKQHKKHVFSLGNTAGRRCAPYQLHKRNPAKAETGTEGKGCLIGNSLQPDQGIGEFQPDRLIIQIPSGRVKSCLPRKVLRCQDFPLRFKIDVLGVELVFPDILQPGGIAIFTAEFLQTAFHDGRFQRLLFFQSGTYLFKLL